MRKAMPGCMCATNQELHGFRYHCLSPKLNLDKIQCQAVDYLLERLINRVFWGLPILILKNPLPVSICVVADERNSALFLNSVVSINLKIILRFSLPSTIINLLWNNDLSKAYLSLNICSVTIPVCISRVSQVQERL